MKNILILIVLVISIIGCSVNNYETDLIKSPSEKYSIKATVNTSDKNADDYADVVIHIYDSENTKIDSINSKAGDFSKWAIGWTNSGDTIVLFSSDIGTKSWGITDNRSLQITVNDKLNQRALELKKQKYNK
jgi:hypothetical protein